VSRLLKQFQQKGLLARSPSRIDARRRNLSLTAAGREVFDTLDRRSRSEIAEMLRELPPENQQKLVTAMHTIETLLAPAPTGHAPWILRSHRTGDMGWVIWRHGVLYAREYGWNQEFEALVTRIVADFISNPDPSSERCWIAERDGTRVGSIFLVRENDEIAKLRLLLVEPAARGLGIGHRLVEECIRTARELGYRRIVLWTNDVLRAARHIYEDKGFRLAREEPHHSFGHDLVGQYWELDLSEIP
jgi:GNAT superfamily N-acetyltransferase